MQGLLGLIEAERRGDSVNRLLLSHLLRMLTALGIYADTFQVPSTFLLSGAVEFTLARSCLLLPGGRIYLCITDVLPSWVTSA